MIEAMARAIAETSVMCGTYSMDGEDAEALAQAAYAVSGCDGLRKRVSELEEALRPFAAIGEEVAPDTRGDTRMTQAWSCSTADEFRKARATLSRGE
jgi:hypothetical protein